MIRGLLVLALVCLRPAGLGAEELETRDGKRHVGTTFRQGEEIRLNPFRSTAADMRLGERRFRARDVRAVHPDSTPTGFWRQLDALRPNDLDGRVGLLRWARTHKLRRVLPRIAAEVLQRQPNHSEAREVLKPKVEAALRAGNPGLDARIHRGLRRLLREPDGLRRKAMAAELARETGAALPAHVVERIVASRTRTRGVVHDVPLRVQAERFPGATYSRAIPLDVDPVRPTPLLIALHGGGIRDVKKGDTVVGSGRDALARFQEGAARAGFLVIAPTAIEGPWPTTDNLAYLEAVWIQVMARWNVDLNRVHLVGHGGGGDGVWAWAARNPGRFASVGVASAGDPKSASSIASRSALWLYHGDEDDIEPVEPVRKTAERLIRSQREFVYCELPGERHGFPPAAQADWFAFCTPRRVRRMEIPWPRSSFSLPPSTEELEALGNPAGAWGETIPSGASAEDLLARMKAGRFDAEAAARALVPMGSPERREAVRALVRDRQAHSVARRAGAWLLGTWRDAEAMPVVGDVLRESEDPLLLTACAWAAGRIGNRDNTEDLRFALLGIPMRYKGVPGNTVPFAELDRACRLGAAVAEALGRVAEAKDVQADVEEALVIGILRDPRRVIGRQDAGEDPLAARAHLARALGRAYRGMKAERTLFDMLFSTVKRQPRVLAAAQQGAREGLR